MEATFLRVVHEVPGVDQNNVILEVNSLRYILLILYIYLAIEVYLFLVLYT